MKEAKEQRPCDAAPPDLPVEGGYADQNRRIIGLTVALYAAPVLVSLMMKGIRQAYDFLSGDVFYYIVVARNANLLGTFTYDHERATNGFHPLWQLWMVLLYRLCLWLSIPDPMVPVVAMLSSLFFICLAIWILGKCFVGAHGRVPLSFLLLPVGVYAVLKGLVLPNYGTLWSYTDGMESACVLLAYSLLLYLMLRPDFLATARSALLLGCVAAFLCLARLDHTLLMPPLFGALGFQCLRRPERKRFLLVLLAGLPVLIAMMAYFAINLAYVGTLIPVSGRLKSCFPHVLDDLMPQTLGFLKRPYNPHALWRLAQIMLPVAVAVIALVRSVVVLRRKTFSAFDFALNVTAVFVLMLGLYNYLYVGLFAQGHWYFPVSVLFVSLFCFHICMRRVPAPPLPGRAAWRRWTAAGVLAIAVLGFFGWAYGREESIMLHRTGAYRFITEEAPGLKEHYKAESGKTGTVPSERVPERDGTVPVLAESVKLLEYSDGVMSFATGFPTFPAYMLMADKEAADKIDRGHVPLLLLAAERGFDRIPVWIGGGPIPLDYGMTSGEIEEELRRFWRFFMGTHLRELEEPIPLSFSVEYVSPSHALVVLRMVLKHDG